MSIAEWILLKFSRKLDEPEYYTYATEKWDIQNALEYIEKSHPGFMEMIKGKRVLDYGCGPGWQSIAMALSGARSVTGVDIRDKWLAFARNFAFEHGVTECVDFVERLDDLKYAQFDVVLSQDSFEHYGDPAGALAEMKSVLKPGGRIALVFTGPWFSPWGSHMQVFTPLPWVNILFPERVVMKVRSRYRNDGAVRYEEIASGLNKMTVARFHRIIRDSGMEVERHFYKGFKKMDFMRFIPVFRELFADQLGCVLIKRC